MSDEYRVSIEVLENGFEVEVPDMAMYAKMKADAKKSKGPASMPYMGDCMKKYAAKSVKEAVKLITDALKQIPESGYDEAFNEAAKAT